MLTAADTLLRESDRLLADARIQPGPLHVLVPYALWVRLMQLAQTVNFLAVSGYAEEAKPLARAMLSTAIAIKLLTVDDLRHKAVKDGVTIDFARESDRRALSYLSHHTVIRRKQNQGRPDGHGSSQPTRELAPSAARAII